MKFLWVLFAFCLFAGAASAQQTEPRMPPIGKNDTIRVARTELDGQWAPWILINDVNIVDRRTFKTKEDRDNYYRLRYNVLKVAPYARFAGNRYRQLERDIATTADKKKQKEMVKACETEIKDLFNKEIKNMSITQGEILIKLVNRETGNTSYALVKELKGTINAFMFQSVARIFGHNLKETYDPDEERDIEGILRTSGYDYHRN
jgi:hypothetical protein